MTKRRHIGKAEKARILLRQEGRCAAKGCGERFMPGDKIQFDHGHDLQFDGPDTEDNLFAKHDDCHLIKTRKNATAKAKMIRLEKRRLNGGEPPGKKPGRRLQSRGFQKTHTKRFDGTVVRRDR